MNFKPRRWWSLAPTPLTAPHGPRHLAETPTERTIRLEAAAKHDVDWWCAPGRHALPEVSDAEWMQAIR